MLFVLLCLGQCGRGINSRFAFGGRLGYRQVLLLSRFLRGLSGLFCDLRSSGGGGYLILCVGQSSFGHVLLCRRPGQLLYRGIGQVLRILLGYLCLGQGSLGLIGRLALGGSFGCGLLLLRLRPAGTLGHRLGLGLRPLGNLLGCLASCRGGHDLVLGVGQSIAG